MRSMDLLFLAAAVSLFPAPARAQHACDLLTTAEVSAAAGGAMHQPPGPVSDIGCAWGGSNGGVRRNVSLSVRPSAEFATAKARLGSVIVPIAHLGDEAFFFPTKRNNAVLYLLKGPHLYTISVTVTTNTLEQNEDAEKALAGQLLLKL